MCLLLILPVPLVGWFQRATKGRAGGGPLTLPCGLGSPTSPHDRSVGSRENKKPPGPPTCGGLRVIFWRVVDLGRLACLDLGLIQTPKGTPTGDRRRFEGSSSFGSKPCRFRLKGAAAHCTYPDRFARHQKEADLSRPQSTAWAPGATLGPFVFEVELTP